MDFNDQLYRYFGTADLDAVPSSAVEAGIERMRVDFGLETDRGRRFALWSILFLLGSAPDLDAFENPADRDAARDFMAMIDNNAPPSPS